MNTIFLNLNMKFHIFTLKSYFTIWSIEIIIIYSATQWELGWCFFPFHFVRINNSALNTLLYLSVFYAANNYL